MSPSATVPDIRFDRRGALAVLTIDRPQAANAFGPTAVAEFRAHLDAIRRDETVAGVIVTGTGSRHFCSGGHVKAYASYASAAELDLVFDAARHALDELEAMPVPTVAALNGIVMGGGGELAFACDFRVMHRDAVFVMPQVRMGIMPGWYSTERMLATCGRANTLHMCLSGKRFSAAECLGFGAVDEVAEDDVVEAAVAFLGQFEGADRRGVAGFKRLVRELADNGRDAGRKLEREIFAKLWFHPQRKP
jgi:enoyl-CoA hydratase/carnithine racemase